MRRTTIVLGATLFLLTLAATAQESRSEISLQGTGFFTSGSSANGTSYSATETGGFLTAYRYHFNHWMSAEAAYGYNRDSQNYLFSQSVHDSVQHPPDDGKSCPQSSVSRQFEVQSLCTGRRRSVGVQSDVDSIQFFIGSAGAS
jgi:hypothetical protein